MTLSHAAGWLFATGAIITSSTDELLALLVLIMYVLKSASGLWESAEAGDSLPEQCALVQTHTHLPTCRPFWTPLLRRHRVAPHTLRSCPLARVPRAPSAAGHDFTI